MQPICLRPYGLTLAQPKFPLRAVVTVGVVSFASGMAFLGVAGYTVYYFSEMKKVVDTFSPTLAILSQALLQVDRHAQAVGATARNIIREVEQRAPEWKAELDRQTAPIGMAAEHAANEVAKFTVNAGQSIANLFRHPEEGPAEPISEAKEALQ